MRRKLFVAALIFIASIGFYIWGYSSARKRIKPEIVEVIQIHEHVDTVFVEKPVPVLQTVRVIDSIPFPVYVSEKDTVYVNLPREQKEYGDSTYHAWVSGFRPELDSIAVYARERLVTITTQVPVPVSDGRRVFIGAQAGYGATYNNKGFGFGPYIGIGVDWRFSMGKDRLKKNR